MEDIFDYDDEELISMVSQENNFAEKWFIKVSKLDDTQKGIYENNKLYNFIVTGCAGSGKTILAIHKLIHILQKEDKNFDSYLFTVYTKALLEFIKDGFNVFLDQLDDKLDENEEDRKLFDFNIDKAKINNIDKLNIDDIPDNRKYLIIDEYQDIEEDVFKKLKTKFKNIMIFGDDDQILYDKDVLSSDTLKKIMGKDIKQFDLKLTYRLPYAVAEFAGQMINKHIEKKCANKQDIKYLPSVIECNDLNEQIDFIIKEIYRNDLKDVGILVHNNDGAKEVLKIVKEKVNQIYDLNQNRTKPEIHYKINNEEFLNFKEKNNITVMVFHSSKGTQFENVFIPKCDKKSIYSTENGYDRALFVACTRTSKNLYILYTDRYGLTKFIEKVDKKTYNKYKYNLGQLTKNTEKA